MTSDLRVLCLDLILQLRVVPCFSFLFVPSCIDSQGINEVRRLNLQTLLKVHESDKRIVQARSSGVCLLTSVIISVLSGFFHVYALQSQRKVAICVVRVWSSNTYHGFPRFNLQLSKTG